MRITLEVDDSRWSAALDKWEAEAHREGVKANLDAAEHIGVRARILLTRLSHPPKTRTPSPRGSAPAAITGTLAASVHAEHDGDDAIVGPTGLARSKNGPYGRFLEMGGTHTAHNPTGHMHWYEDGRWFEAKEIRKGERPFLKPATDDAIASGSIGRIYRDHWLEAQRSVT